MINLRAYSAASWGAQTLAFVPAPLRWAEASIATVIGSGVVLWLAGLGADDRRQVKFMVQRLRPQEIQVP